MLKKTFQFVGLSLFVALFLVSCGPPKTYESGMNFYNTQKYDSALYYFDRLLPEDEEWLDSAKLMKKRCFEKMILEHLWDMYSAQLIIFGKDTSLMNPSNKLLESELLKMSSGDSIASFYKLFDQYSKKFNSEIMGKVMKQHIDSFLTGYKWEGRGGINYTTLEYKINKDGVNQLSSSRETWFKEITYQSEGVFSMKPKIYRGGYSYFGKNGTMRFLGKDSLKVNYGTALTGGSVYILVRGKKLEPASK